MSSIQLDSCIAFEMLKSEHSTLNIEDVDTVEKEPLKEEYLSFHLYNTLRIVLFMLVWVIMLNEFIKVSRK